MNTNEKNSRKTADKNPIPNNKPFKKGVSGNPNGRAKKYITQVTDRTGYKNSEIADCIKSMLRMTMSEITKVSISKDAPVLEKIIASGIQSDIEKGELRNLETLMNRSYGKSKEFIEIEQIDKTKELSKEELGRELDKMGLRKNLFDV